MTKNRFGSFPFLFAVVYCPLIAAALLSVYFFGSPESFKGFVWGTVTSIVLITATVIIAEKTLKEATPIKVFSFIGGGFSIRFIVVLAICALVFLKTDLDIWMYLVGLFSSYIVLEAFSIIHVKKLQVKYKTDDHEHNDKSND